MRFRCFLEIDEGVLDNRINSSLRFRVCRSTNREDELLRRKIPASRPMFVYIFGEMYFRSCSKYGGVVAPVQSHYPLQGNFRKGLYLFDTENIFSAKITPFKRILEPPGPPAPILAPKICSL